MSASRLELSISCKSGNNHTGIFEQIGAQPANDADAGAFFEPDVGWASILPIFPPPPGIPGCLFKDGTSHLRFADFAIDVAARHQRSVVADANQAPLVNDKDHIGAHHRADTLGDDNGCRLPAEIFGNGAAQVGIGLIVKRRRGIVKDKNFGLSRQRPSNQRPLLLAAADVCALGGQHVSIAVVKILDEGGGLRQLCRKFNLGVLQLRGPKAMFSSIVSA